MPSQAPDGLQVRPWRAGDVDGLIALAQRNGGQVSHRTFHRQLEHERLAALEPELHTFRRLVAEIDGEIVGTALAHDDLFLPRRWLAARVQVSGTDRRRGVGAALARRLQIELPVPVPGLEASIGIGDGRSRSWSENRGFRLRASDVTCALDLEAHPRPVAHDARLPAGIRLFSMAEEPGAESWSRLSRLVADLFAQLPWSGGACGAGAEAIESGLTRLMPVVPEATWVATSADRWVGVTIVTEHGGHDTLYSWFTGVDQGVRGRGVATRLKLRSMEGARLLGTRRLVSQTQSTNFAMLEVNQRLGCSLTEDTWLMERPPDVG